MAAIRAFPGLGLKPPRLAMVALAWSGFTGSGRTMAAISSAVRPYLEHARTGRREGGGGADVSGVHLTVSRRGLCASLRQNVIISTRRQGLLRRLDCPAVPTPAAVGSVTANSFPAGLWAWHVG